MPLIRYTTQVTQASNIPLANCTWQILQHILINYTDTTCMSHGILDNWWLNCLFDSFIMPTTKKSSKFHWPPQLTSFAESFPIFPISFIRYPHMSRSLFTCFPCLCLVWKRGWRAKVVIDWWDVQNMFLIQYQLLMYWLHPSDYHFLAVELCHWL